MYITVDGGTTNTRIYLVSDRKVTDSLKLSAGLKAGLPALKTNLKEGISSLLERNGLSSKDITRVLASGMISSEYGLCELPHTQTPSGAGELKASIHTTVFPEICDIEWSFIRGVKTDCTSIEQADMIRGEETEVMGLVDFIGEAALYILPGSHSKHISVDSNGNITNIKTILTGELFAAIIGHTVLKDATDFEHAHIDGSILKQGYEYCRSHGFGETLFKTRVLKNIFGETKEGCYSFLMGAILYDEIRAIGNARETLIVIGGQKYFRHALSLLLNDYCTDKKTVTLSDSEVDNSVALGAVKIYEYSNN